MDLIEILAGYGSWSWIVGGLVLLAIELLAPGGVFIWLGGAAVGTGLISLVTIIGWPMQWAIFGVLSIAAIMAWLAIRRRAPIETDRPFLNKRADKLIGREGFLSEPIIGQTGRMEVGDSVWRVTGPELPTGHRVRIIGHKGTMLEVESVEPNRVETA